MEALRPKYNLIVQRKKTNYNVNEDETPALFANFQQSHHKKQFKGVCRICGKYGHKADDCWHNEKKDKNPNNNNNNNNNNWLNSNNQENNSYRYYENSDSKIRCWYCNKMGHKAKECWKKKKDQERKKNENANGMMANHEETKLVDTNSKCNEDFCLMATTANIDDQKLSK